MTVGWESVLVDGADMKVYVGTPVRGGNGAGIIIAQHGAGVDAQIQDAVHRLHREGYVVAAPELFHRLPANADSPRSRFLKDDEILDDVNATIAHLRVGPLGSGPVFIVGFCMGGRVSYLCATAIPELKAAVVFYGGNIMKALGNGDSPFGRSSAIECPLLGFFGENDANPSPADVAQIATELTRLGKWHEFHVFRDTSHAFHDFLGERYRSRAADSSWAAMLAFLSEQLT